MSQPKIAVFGASLRKDSFHRWLARVMERLALAEFAFRRVPIDGLPLYSQGFVHSCVAWTRRFAP